VKESYIQDTT
jgi:hypothetical protein